MVRSEGYEIKRGAHFRGVPITKGSDLIEFENALINFG
jgi:hypothetical protein